MTINFQNYTVIKECKGNQANKIYIVEEKQTKQVMILKLIKIYDLDKQLREIEVHKKLNHKFVIKMIDYDISKTHIILLIEYAKYGDLFSMLPKLKEIPEKRLLKFYYQFLKAMDYLHSEGFVHRDIKPENILITKKFSPRLADFGTSAKTDFVKNTFCGTYEYMAPEIYLRHKQTEKVDIWALGILLYEMTHQFTPFKKKSVNEMKKMLEDKKIEFRKDLNPLIKALILKILKFNPVERPTTKEMLADPLFSDFNQKNKSNVYEIGRASEEDRPVTLSGEDMRNEKFASLPNEIKESDVIDHQVITPVKEESPKTSPGFKTPLKKVASCANYVPAIPIVAKPVNHLDFVKTKSINEITKKPEAPSSKKNIPVTSLREMDVNCVETSQKPTFKEMASNRAIISSTNKINPVFEQNHNIEKPGLFTNTANKNNYNSTQKLDTTLKNGLAPNRSNCNSSGNLLKNFNCKLVKVPTAILDNSSKQSPLEKPIPAKKPNNNLMQMKKNCVSMANLDCSSKQLNNSLLKQHLLAFAKTKPVPQINSKPLGYHKPQCSIDNLN